MKIIVDLEKKTLRMLENERSIFKGEKSADKLELYINKLLENEYPTITALLSNGRRLGAYSTDSEYRIEYIDDIQYTIASFTLSKENGFTLSEGKMQITIWMNTINGKREAIGNVLVNVVNTTAYDDGDIIISGDDVEGTVVNFKIELENLQGQINSTNLNFAELKSHNLGEVGNPFLAQNNILNSIIKNGLYTFKWSDAEHLMLVSDTEGAGIHQFIIRGVNTNAEYIIRKSTDNGVTWTISDGVISSKQYIDILMNALNDNAPAYLNTLGKLATFTTDNKTKLDNLQFYTENKIRNYYDLGEINNFDDLKNYTQSGIYTFTLNSIRSIMIVETQQISSYAGAGGDITPASVYQTIITRVDDENLAYSILTFDGSVWNEKVNYIATEEYVNTVIANLVNSAPETLDTLGELAMALQENDSVVEALNSSISNKADKTYVDNKLGDIQSLLEAI